MNKNSFTLPNFHVTSCASHQNSERRRRQELPILSTLSCPWFLSAILLHANFKEMVLLLSDPYKFSTWSQLKAETRQSSFALFHCCEIKSVRWLPWCGDLQLKTHQLCLSARQRRKWKDAFKRLTHYVQKQFHTQECAKSTDTDVFLCKNE